MLGHVYQFWRSEKPAKLSIIPSTPRIVIQTLFSIHVRRNKVDVMIEVARMIA